MLVLSQILKLTKSVLFDVIHYDLDRPTFQRLSNITNPSSISDDNLERTDLSHPVHSDNCILQPDGSCKREAPAYVQRDYRLVNFSFKTQLFYIYLTLLHVF